MSLSCDCGGDYDWYYEPYEPEDYTTLQTKRRRRCCSCNVLIDIGAICLRFYCHRPPRHDIEEGIYGDEVPMADKYLCEECSDLYFSFTELGFCINLGENMLDLVQEYQQDYLPRERAT